jgi:hypothetical protein
VTGRGFLEAHQQLPEAVQPRLGPLDHPASGASLRVPASRPGILAPLRDVGHIPPGSYGLIRRLTRVPFVPTEVLAMGGPGPRPATDDPVQRGGQEPHVMPVGAAHDEGQRDSIPVDEEAAFGPPFSPDPSGSARRLRGRGGL